MKRIMFLTRYMCHFSPFYFLFVVLCWYIVSILGILQEGAFVREIGTKMTKNEKKASSAFMAFTVAFP